MGIPANAGCRRWLRAALLLAGAVALAGCIDMETRIQVHADGSGTVREEVLVAERLVAPLRALVEGLGKDDARGLGLYDMDRLQRRAAAMGEGVRLVEVRERRVAGGEGYMARYAFDDVEALRIDASPGGRAPSLPGRAERPPGGMPAQELRFEHEPGEVTELRIHMPPVRPGDGEDEQRRPSTGDLERARRLLEGFRVAVTVSVAGRILETNASHVASDGRITLVELRLDELLGAREHLERLQRDPPRSLADLERLLADVPGITVEMEPEVLVRFEGPGLHLTRR